MPRHLEEEESDEEETSQVDNSEVASEDERTSSSEDTAATKIQALYRGFRDRKNCGSHKHHRSATKIQKAFRGYSSRKQTKLKKERENKACAQVQRVWRGYSERSSIRRKVTANPPIVNVTEETGVVECTFAIIKPDAMRKGFAAQIKHRILADGFHILQERQLQLSTDIAQEFYAEHLGKPFFEKLTNFMSSGPVTAMVLSRVNAIKAWRSLMGPTNPVAAAEQFPNSLRALYGDKENTTMNATHGSDARLSAQREIKFFFPKRPIFPAPTHQQSHEYIQASLMPTLTEGLANLAKKKPAEPIKWLAYWLLENNPNKPRVSEPVS
ncbi:hypothetical protein PROFUN_13735 [Planoprotostelium fungivorum]|uniref:Nucleoside diphosphate kinase-like domain-containing protein n=1 Tax=Planoprotostelium fungivorum TaxID=1890364 RepID=A0A2P6MWV5_9EUKA|nr:hypothetical protein PROFUN_13735 [Planoprotostelium fungivorum]